MLNMLLKLDHLFQFMIIIIVVSSRRSFAKVYFRNKLLIAVAKYTTLSKMQISHIFLLPALIYTTIILIIKLDLDAWNFTTILFTTCAAKRHANLSRKAIVSPTTGGCTMYMKRYTIDKQRSFCEYGPVINQVLGIAISWKWNKSRKCSGRIENSDDSPVTEHRLMTCRVPCVKWGSHGQWHWFARVGCDFMMIAVDVMATVFYLDPLLTNNVW